MTTSGDVLISQSFDGDLDINFQNGQPGMTDGFETCVILAVFGEKCVLNSATSNPDEEFNSTFPAVIRRANVSDATRQNGEKAIEKALAFRIGSNTVVVYDGIGCGFKRLTGFQTIEDQIHGSLAAIREAPYAPTS